MTRTEYEEGKRLLAALDNHDDCAKAALSRWLRKHAAELLDAVNPKPMLRGRTSAETCRLNGWEVGDVLVGTPGGEHLELAAIGRAFVLASAVREGGKLAVETTWDFNDREWHKEEA